MSEVLIIARTNMGAGKICLGGLDLESGLLVRPMTTDGYYFADTAPFEVGSIWNLEYSSIEGASPPHVEDRRITKVTSTARDRHFPEMNTELHARGSVHVGDPTTLFQNRLEWLVNAHGHRLAVIAEDTKLPTSSLQIWQTDRDLELWPDPFKRDRLYLRAGLPERGGTWQVKYVGASPLGRSIPTGSIVSLSLARWWRRRPWDPLRCYLQVCNVLSD